VRRSRFVVFLFVGLVLAVAGAVALAGGGSVGPQRAGASPPGLTALQLRHLSGFASLELANGGATSGSGPVKVGNYVPSPNRGCPTNLASNIKVNQNCLNVSDPDLQGRGQAQNETSMAAEPGSANNLVAGYNDYRRGDGTCGVSYSGNGGQSWSDATLPNGFVRGTAFGAARQYFESGGDPSVAWDTKGNAYYACGMFDRGPGTTTSPDFSSGIYVFRSTGNGGASWNFTGRPAIQQPSSSVVPLLDKPYMTVDNNAASPFQDRIYVTWTLFAADGTAYIYEAHSSDYGETFSSPVVVSTTSSLCNQTYGLPTPNGTCNENQDSDPFTGPDGALYVAYNNFNNAVTGSDNRNQVLLVKSTDGGATFSAPVKVADYYDLPDCATYQNGANLGRACVPEQGSAHNSIFRATNYPSGAVNPTNPNQVAVTFGSYINPDSKEPNCVPAGLNSTTGLNLYTGVKTAGGCNNDILLSVSNNGGASFTGTNTDPRSLPTITPGAGATADQWWQWAAFTNSGTLAVSYYDRQYGNDETSGDMDITLSSSSDLSSFKSKRVTSASMPLPTQFPDANGNSVFFGDYSGLAVGQNANPIWMDTRNLDLFICPSTSPPALCSGIEPSGITANDQDIFTSSVGIPK
jgi:hypothetical protein